MYSSNQDSQRNVSSTSIPASQRIYILGIGNLGRLFAHALATQPNPPPITLLFHRKSLLTEWEQAGRAIELTTKGIASRSAAYDIELLNPEDGKKDHGNDKIHNLIITTKATQTIQALRPIANRIHPSSTLLFAQNGMGAVSKLTNTLGPEYEAFSVIKHDNNKSNNLTPQPRYLAAIVSHGLYSTTRPFHSVHAGLGSIALGQASLPPSLASKAASETTISASNPNYLLSHILTSPLLSATAVTPSELYLLQLEKLAANAIVNPLTALFRFKNGEVFSHPPLIQLIRLLLSEISAVFTYHLSEISSHKFIDPVRFSPERLETLVRHVVQKTAENTSSMLQDVRAGKETEIDFINGWVMERAREVGVSAVINERIVGFVKQGRIMEMQNVEECLL